MNIAITMIDPTASKAATAPTAATTTRPKPTSRTGTPTLCAKASSNVAIFEQFTMPGA